MKLIIVRHGETLWNKQGKLQGQKDTPISRNGLKQARILAKRLSKEKIALVYTSKLQRAVKTAQEIRKFYNGLRIIQDKNLNEMSFGIWEGLKMGYIKKKFKELYEKREKDKFNFKIPKGESPLMLKNRLKKILSKIKQNKNKNVLIVGHNGVNRTILGILLNWSDGKILSVRLNNASISVVNIKNNKAKLHLLNSSYHLKNGNL